MASRNLPLLTPHDLVTLPVQADALRAAIALEKRMIALPYVEEAKTLKFIARRVHSPKELLNLTDIDGGLIAASGLTGRAFYRLNDDEKVSAILGLGCKSTPPSGENFPDELELRYLFSKRKILHIEGQKLANSLGYRKFLRSLVSVLSVADVEYSWKDRNSQVWIYDTKVAVGAEQNVSALYWRKKGKNRLLLLNVSVPLIAKNVDLVVLDAKRTDLSAKDKKLLEHNTQFVALGELKGGIDPDGSDEHWKTANFALNRVRSKFQTLGLNPPTFFIGAAIERSMAAEIVQQLNSRVLTRAANLTNSTQLTTICEWLMNL